MTGLELAEEFTDLWKDLDIPQINTMLAKNVEFDLLKFFQNYAQDFVEDLQDRNGPGQVDWDDLRCKLPNLLIIGYIIRLLEERVE